MRAQQALCLAARCGPVYHLRQGLPSDAFPDRQPVTQKLLLRDGFSNLSKHIRVRGDYVWEAHLNGEVKIQYIPSGDNPADILTKNLSRDLFYRYRDALNVRACPGAV